MPLLNIAVITSTQTASSSIDVNLIDASLGNIVLTLYDIGSTDGLMVRCRRTDTGNANSVSITGFSSGQTIDGNNSFNFGTALALTGRERTLVSLGNVWYSVGE